MSRKVSYGVVLVSDCEVSFRFVELAKILEAEFESIEKWIRFLFVASLMDGK